MESTVVGKVKAFSMKVDILTPMSAYYDEAKRLLEQKQSDRLIKRKVDVRDITNMALVAAIADLTNKLERNRHESVAF